MAINEEVRILIKAKDEATNTLKGIGAQFGGLAKSIVGIGAAYLTWNTGKKLLTDIVKAGIEAETAMSKLKDSVSRSGQAWEKVGKQFETFATATQKLTGFDDEQIIEGLAKLTNFGASATTSMKSLSIAADFAAANAMDLTSAVTLLAKVEAGNLGAISRYIGAIDENLPEAQKLEAVKARLEEMFSGAAAARMRTVAGRMLDVNNAWEDFLQSIYEGANSGPLLAGFLAGLAESLRQVPIVLNAGIDTLVAWWKTFRAVLEAASNNLSAFVGFAKALLTGEFEDEKVAFLRLTTALSTGAITVDNALMHAASNAQLWAIKTGLAIGAIATTGADATTEFLARVSKLNTAITSPKDQVKYVDSEHLVRVGETEPKMSVPGLEEIDIDPIRKGLEEGTQAILEWKQRINEIASQVGGAISSALTPALVSVITKARNVSDAFRGVGQSIRDSLLGLAINALVQFISKQIVSLFLTKGEAVAHASNTLAIAAETQATWALVAAKIALNAASGGVAGGVEYVAKEFIGIFDNKNNDAMLEREVRWVGTLITRGLTSGMQSAMGAMALPQPAIASAGAQNITINFHGPVTSADFVRNEVIPQIERAVGYKQTRLASNKSTLTGVRDGYGA